MQEWMNVWNPFNSAKVLLWREWLEACAKEDYLPPVTVDIDPSGRCNYNCIWCNALDIRKQCRQDLPEEHLLKLADFLKDWGVKSACISGGGEPLMNRGFLALLERMKHNGLESGVITNGICISTTHCEIISKTCRWIGFSIDAATSETYNKVKGLDIRGNFFNRVLRRICHLNKIKRLGRKLGNNLSVAYKFLLHPYNAHEIYDAAKLAKEIGCNDFHLRPVGWDNLTITKGKKKLNMAILKSSIDKQIKEAMKLENGYFHVYGVRHKFNPDFTRKINFKRCWAIPMLPTFGADGNVHTCFDMRGRKDLILCQHYPDPSEILKVWNTEKHKEMIRKINPQDCPRCTFGTYNEIVEKVILEDSMCRNFP